MADTLSYKLKLESEQFARGIRQSTGALDGLKGQAGATDSRLRGLGGAGAGLSGLRGLAAGATAAFGPLLAVLTSVALAAGGVGSAMAKAADFESTAVAFETLVGNADMAAETLGKLKKFGAETPLEFPDIAQSAKLLIAFGESASTVTESLRRVGDISSGVGANITEISEIYGKARVAGTLFAEDINQLLGRGIPVIGEFAKQLGVSEGEVKKLASEGKVTFPMLEKAFVSLTSEGGKFYDMMKKQAGTTKGLISTLKDNFNDLLITIGTPINDALKPMLQGAIALVGRVGDSVKMMITAMRTAIADGEVGEALTRALTLGVGLGINAILDAFEALPGKLMGVLETLGNAIAAALSGSWEAAQKILTDIMKGGRYDPSDDLSWFKSRTKDAKEAKTATEEVTKATQAAAAAANAEAAGGKAGVEAPEEKKIRGYSWRKQGDAAAARARAAARMNDADARVAADYKRAFPGLEGAPEFQGRERPRGMPGVYGDDGDPTTAPKPESLRGRFNRTAFPGLDQNFGPAGPGGKANINLAAPGTATRQQDRREAAASASQGEKQRWDLVQKISEQLGNLVAA